MILIIGPNQDGVNIVFASHDNEALPEAVTKEDILNHYPNATKILFVKKYVSLVDEDGTPLDTPDPEHNFSVADAQFNRKYRCIRKIQRAQLDAIDDGQSGSEKIKWKGSKAGDKLTFRVRFDFLMPADESIISFSNAQRQNCVSPRISRQVDAGFEIEVTSSSDGDCAIMFDWSVSLD